MKKDWKSKVIEAILIKEVEKAREITSDLDWVKNHYNFKRKEYQKKVYLDLLGKAFFIKDFEIDCDKKQLIYTDENDKKQIRKGKIGRISSIPKFHLKKDIAIYTNIKALISGKKQEACIITVNKRRLENGKYKGIDETIKNTNLYERSLKIAKNRKKNNTYVSMQKKNINQIKEEMQKKIPGYILKSEKYHGNKTKMEFICNNGHLFKMRWNNIASGQKCPYCNIYKNEEECRQIFEKITGNKFEKIRPDFLINPKTDTRLELDGYCENLKIAFEYDGRQHYEPVDYFGGIKCFTDLQKNDIVKNELCEKNGIKLIRIPYWIENKEEYIKGLLWQELSELKKEN